MKNKKNAKATKVAPVETTIQEQVTPVETVNEMVETMAPAEATAEPIEIAAPIETVNEVAPVETPAADPAPVAIEAPVLVKPGKKGVTNAQMIPVLREVIMAGDTETLALIKTAFPSVYDSSVKYLTKDQKGKLAAFNI